MLRPYQQEIIDDVRESIRTRRSVMAQLGTGGGKTHIFAAITARAFARDNRVWICVPRNELIWQTSKKLFEHGVTHGIIQASQQESRAYKVHVISMSTIKRRIRDGKIKNWPDIIIFDEGHIELDGQKYIVMNSPDTTRYIGFTATPERGDGRGLKHCPGFPMSHNNNGIYDAIVFGRSIEWMIERNYLSEFKYFSPPLDGLEDLHTRGTDYDKEELDAFFKRKAVYGQAIEHYRKLADGKPCLVYCRSVKAAEDIAGQFCAAGYRFASIDGRMTDKQRESLITGVKTGRIQGLTSCDLITYGLDVPNIECIIMLRPTLSRALFFQMLGRGIRVSKGKEYCIILDHVGNIREHIEIEQGQTLYNALSVEWHFCGVDKRGKRKKKSAIVLRFCENCYQYFEGSSCPHCGHEKKAIPKNIQVIDGQLVEHKGPIPLKERPYEEQREFHDRIGQAKDAFEASALLGEIDYGAVKDMILLGEDLGYAPMWAYYRLNNLEHAVNVPLLNAIANTTTKKKKKYKSYWLKLKKDELKRQLKPAEPVWN